MKTPTPSPEDRPKHLGSCLGGLGHLPELRGMGGNFCSIMGGRNKMNDDIYYIWYVYIYAASQQCVCIPLLNPQLRTFAELVGRIWEAYLEITWRFKWRWSNELSELDLIHPMAIWSFQQTCETLRNHRGGRHCPLILWFIGVVRGSRNLRSVRNLGPKIALDWLWISIRNLTWNR